MSGRILAGGIVVFAIFFGALLYWFQVHAYYQTVTGLVAIQTDDGLLQVVGYEGIDADSSPLKLRGCFRMDPASLEDAPPAEDPAPLIAPGWFDCFDAAAIGADLEAGRARAVRIRRDTPAGFDEIVAFYPDGRAFRWRQVAGGAR